MDIAEAPPILPIGAAAAYLRPGHHTGSVEGIQSVSVKSYREQGGGIRGVGTRFAFLPVQTFARDFCANTAGKGMRGGSEMPRPERSFGRVY